MNAPISSLLLAPLAICLVAGLASSFSSLAPSPAVLRQEEVGLAFQGLRPERSEFVFRYYCLTGNLKFEQLRQAVEGLGEGAEVVLGPESPTSRPSTNFIAIRIPVAVPAKKALRAMKKGSKKAEALVYSAFSFEVPSGADTGLGGGGGGFLRGMILGISGDLRWVEFVGNEAAYFYVPGKLDADELAKRIERMAAPYVEEPREVEPLAETIEWDLVAPVTKKSAKKAEKAIARTSGVITATIDFEKARLRMRVRHADLMAAGDSPAGSAKRPRLLVNPILDALEDAGLAVDESGEESMDGEAAAPAPSGG